MTLQPVLVDPAAQAELDDEGFVVLPGAAAADVDELRRIFHEVHGDVPPPSAAPRGQAWEEDWSTGTEFETDLEGPFSLRDQIEERLAPIWARHLDALFLGHRPLVSTFLMKWPGPTGHLPLHQDPSFVDESASRAVTLWIAIDDTSPELGNGPLHVLPRSHLMAEEYRGTNTPSTFSRFLDQAWRSTIPVPVAAGDAVVLDGQLVHGSPPNRTDRLRLAVCTPVVPNGTPLVHTLGVDDDHVVVLPVEDDFYRRTSPRRLHARPPTPAATVAVRRRAPRPFRVEYLDLAGTTSP